MKQNIISKQFISSFLVILYVKNTLKAKSPYVCRVIHGLCVCDFVALLRRKCNLHSAIG